MGRRIKVSLLSQLICPLCSGKISSKGKEVLLVPRPTGGFVCDNGHHFDQARQGYVNLLPVQHKRSRDPGDTKEMVQARRRFLQAGHYAPLAEQLAAILNELAPADSSLLDAGCGEGYYLRQLQTLLPEYRFAGNDISKWAIQAAAPWQKSASYAVASNARLPFAQRSMDIVLCAFGFAVIKEFARVLKPGGLLIMVDPAGEHLNALREILYPELKPSEAKGPLEIDNFVCVHQHRLSFPFSLQSSNAIYDLLAMTPHIHRAGKAGLSRISAIQNLQVTADINIHVYQKTTSKQSDEETV